MKKFLQKLRNKVVVGLVGGSDLVKIEEQMANSGVMRKGEKAVREGAAKMTWNRVQYALIFKELVEEVVG